MSKNTASLVSVIESVFRRNGGWIRLRGEMAVYYWPRIAGQELANKVNAVSCKAGRLLLQTESPAWAHQLTLLIPEIRSRYQKLLGKGIIKEIRVKIGPIQAKVLAAPPPEPVSLNNEETGQINEYAQVVTDPELNQKLQAAMTRSYLNRKMRALNGGERCNSCEVVIGPGFNYCPSCERKLKEEISTYLSYLKKQNQVINMADLEEKGLKEANQLLIERILQLEKAALSLRGKN